MSASVVTVLDPVADAIASIRTDRLPEPTVQAARVRVFDTVCATRVGRLTPDGRALERATAAVAGQAVSSPPERIALAVGACRATEMDDIHPGACVTAGAIVVPTALVLGAQLEVDDATLLAAIVAGYEAGVLLGRAIGGPAALGRGVWPTYAIAPLIAAAVTARLHGCDAPATRRALELAAGRCAESLPADQPVLPARWLAIGAAAHDGVVAAAAAAHAGIRGAPITGAADGVVPSLGGAVVEPWTSWGILEVETKPFATARQGLSPLQALLMIADADDGRRLPARVDFDVPAEFQGMLGGDAHDRWSSLISLRAQATLAFADRERLWDPVRARRLPGSAGAARAGAVGVHPDASLSALLPDRWAGRARVTWADDGSEEVTVTDPRGSARDPMSWKGHEDKWSSTLSAVGASDPEWLDAISSGCRRLAAQRSSRGGAALAAAAGLAMEHDKERVR